MTIQIVCVKWDTKYAARHVNSLYRSLMAKTSEELRFVCITDRPEEDFMPGIHVKRFPGFGVPLDEVKRGCLAKLGMFSEGMLHPRLPTIYIDLDTIILGDIATLANRLRSNPGMYMMRSHWVPTWRFVKLTKLVAPRFYYHGNSSILAFFPNEFYYLAELFKQKLKTGETYFRKTLGVDDRFISCFARGRIRVFQSSDAVKFASEYVSPLPITETIRKRLPWVARRRNHLVAVTFPGNDLEPEQIAAFKAGQRIKVKKGSVVWDFAEYTRYWQDVASTQIKQ